MPGALRTTVPGASISWPGLAGPAAFRSADGQVDFILLVLAGRKPIHCPATDGIADQPECWEANGGGHTAYLTVSSFAYLQL